MFVRVRYIWLAALIVLVGTVTAQAATVTLEWDANEEADVAGYQVVYGTRSGDYSATVDVGTRTSFAVGNLEAGRSYYFAVRAYDISGAVSSPSSEVSTIARDRPLALAAIAANTGSPAAIGTAVVFAAIPTGGVYPYKYKWFVSNGSQERVVRDWSEDNTYTWIPDSLGSNFTIKAWVRNAGSTADAPENASSLKTVPFAVVNWSGPVGSDSLTSSMPSPQRADTPIAFLATAARPGPYNYKWLLTGPSGTKVVRDWSSSNTYLWLPVVPGSYTVRVQLRSAASSDAPVASEQSLSYEISNSNAVRINLSADHDGPRSVGSTTVFAADASGNATAFLYQWSVYDGSRWSIAKPWSGESQFSWTPSAPNDRYQVRVQVRGGRSIAADAALAVLFPIVP